MNNKKVYPFTAIVGQDDMKLAILIAAVDQSVGGVLVFGDRGTGKSTAVRALAQLLPKVPVVPGCAYNAAPDTRDCDCDVCKQFRKDDKSPRNAPLPVVDLPLGATEDRVVGALDLEKALSHGEKSFEPGLLARANRGFLYIDEVNLLEDHLVDLLLDVAQSGENLVEREGLSVRHPAKFVLVGSGNPEEGELRPQLLDRFGLSLDVKTPVEIDDRVEIIRRRDAFEQDPAGFCRKWARREGKVRKQILDARERISSLRVSDDVMAYCARLCTTLGTDGLRGELTLMRAGRAFAALHDADTVSKEHIVAIAPMALRHRLRRNPLDDADAGVRVERALTELHQE